MTGCSITITVNFGDNNLNNKSGKGKDINYDDEELEAEEREKRRKEEEDAFEKIMRKQRMKQSSIDFISKNMEQAVEWPQEQKKKLYRIKTKLQRLEESKSRKELIEDEQRKKKLFLLHRWEILKDKRREMYEERMWTKMLR